MTKSYLASVAGALLCAGVVFGQVPKAAVPVAGQMSPAVPAVPAVPQGCDPALAAPSFPAPGGVFTGNIDYELFFFANSRDSVPLELNGTPGGAGTTVLGSLGDAEQQKRTPISGAHLALGYWLVGDNFWAPGGVRDLGAEAVFFFAGQQSARFVDQTSSNIFRPFFDVTTHQPSAFVVAEPGLATGGIAANARDRLWGAEANVWKNVYADYPGTTCIVQLMAGFRYLDLDQSLDVASVSRFNRDLTAFPAFLPFAGNTLQVVDSFSTHNRFYGGQVGIGGKWWPLYGIVFEAEGKLAVGATSENLTVVSGQVRTLANSDRIFSQAGLLALPSNSGSFHQNKFSQVPELDFKVEAPLTSHLTLSTGFSCLYWSRILRPAEQIDRALDVTQIPNFPAAAAGTPTGLNQPGVPFRQSDLWVLGLSIGVEVNW